MTAAAPPYTTAGGSTATAMAVILSGQACSTSEGFCSFPFQFVNQVLFRVTSRFIVI
uniref:Uncharacterized protein n=1 Tax=Helianthus annuus TaxID=4232 RepID=A0A251RMI2_HELAN